ncbi:MAG: hypothetical protein U5L08_06655 [Xanthomonadales bacterium]|nr:hypothetical protein [Xanthomonadales bacterium]
MAAATTLFLLPAVIFTVLLRKHLLARHHLRSGAAMSADPKTDRPRRGPLRRILRRGPWEPVAMALIGLGVVMMTQPFSLWLYSNSFTFILAGTLGYLVVSHFPE